MVFAGTAAAGPAALTFSCNLVAGRDGWSCKSPRPSRGSTAIAAIAPDPAKPGKIALIDGHSLFHRAFFALPPLATPQGQPTGAVYGFLTMLLRLLEDERPTHLAVAMDRPEPTFRHTEFREYKAQRAEMPSDLRSQLPLLRRVLQALAVPTAEHAGAEADDVIGTLATSAAALGFEVVIVTGDRDALQLVSPLVTVLYTRRGITEIDRMDPAAVTERYGVGPERLVDVKALVGDTSDNYPGVPTIGEKTASKLVAAFGTVDDLLQRLGEVGPPRVQKALGEHAETVRRNKRLATILRDVPVPFEPADLRRAAPEAGEALAVFDELGFRSLAPRFGLGLPGEEPPSAAPEAEPGEAAPARPGAGDEPPAEPVPHTPVSAAAFGAALVGHVGAVALAAAWDGPPAAGDAGWGPPAPSALAATLSGSGVAPILWERTAEGGGPAPVVPPLPELLAADSKRVCHLVLAAGGRWETPAFDAALAGYLLESDRSTYPLADLCRQFGLAAPPPRDLPAAAAAIEALRAPALAALRSHGLEGVYTEIELPLVGVLAAMERAGVSVDRAALAALEGEFAARLVAAEADIHAAAGEVFNPNSTQQLARILFEKIGLKPPRKTKTGYSTDADVLEQLAAEHELPGKVLTYRSLQKLQSTYVTALPGFIAGDGRIHTDFRQTAAATGRLASNNPNLQNIPVREDVGRRIRRVFVAPPGCALVAADYSQVELRILAHFSGDAGLIDAFREGRDIHRATAAEVWGVPPGDVTDAQRSAAKAVNFGIVYGISDFGLARQLNCPVPEAKAVITRYFQRYPGVKRYMDGAVAEARERGMVRTHYGRLRRLPDITGRNFARRSFAERMAMNTPIQGTAADIIKRAMIAVHAEIAAAGLRAHLILQVHDELIAEAPEGEVGDVARLLRRCMEGAGELSVPLRADVSAGPNWMELRDLEA